MRKFLDKNPQVLSAVMNDEIKFHPANMKNTYRHWMENIKDWCISRQLWWGQRIPAWYAPDGEYVVAKTENEAIALFAQKGKTVNAGELKQDEDVLDTWFSSWLWPISVFDGFEDNNNKDIKYYYPTNDLVTAPEIMFFWVARMIMAGYEWMGQKPFSNVYYTGIVRDKQRRKMSKSLGNSPDPLDLIAKYGADGVRMGMLLCSPAGNDILFDEALVEQGRNFTNKIWNALRLVKGWQTIADEKLNAEVIKSNAAAAQWMRGRLNAALVDIEQGFSDYRLSEVLMRIYKLIWDDYCAWYLEMIKPPFGEPINESAYEDAVQIFDELMRVLHPYMPFITEEVWQHINARKQGESICTAAYPKSDSHADALQLDAIIECITKIRELRNAKAISPKERFDISIKSVQPTEYKAYEYLLRKLAGLNEVHYVSNAPEKAILVPVGKDEVFAHLHIETDEAADKEKMQKELEYLEGFLKSVEAKLSNEKFVANAKPELVEKERQKQADAIAKIEVLRRRLN